MYIIEILLTGSNIFNHFSTSIIQVTATDADDPTYGNSAKLVYTLVQGQQYFSVDPQTGILRTAVPDMDRETQDQYLVVLQAKDMGGHLGGLSGTTTITVRLTDVNDNPPRFTQSMWSFSVSELAIPGAEIGRISATDADLGENAKLEYTILEGETGDTFNITGVNQEAVITLNKVDYESRSSYSFSVEVLNPIVDPRFLRRGPFKDRASIRVAVLDADEPPRFSRARYHMDVSENCPPACTVGRVSAVDPDTGLTNNIRFSIDPQSDPEALFRITPDTGLITTAMELDREREHWHNITVIATQRDNPSQVSRVLVAIETLDLNDNAPELDRQYTTAMCDSSSIGQVVQVLRAIDRDEGGNDSTVYFSIPPESRAALNFSVRDSGASLVLLSQLQPLSRSQSSTLTLHVPLVLRDGTSGLTSTGTVTVSVCPCLRGGARAVCLPQQSTLPSPGLSTAALLAILACVATLLAVSALSLSLRRQKRDSLSPLEEDDVRENIITYDDEGGGEADTAAFDIAALQSAPTTPSPSPKLKPLVLAYVPSRGPPGPGGPSLALRVGEFLRLRLAQVTFDPSQPPYDSVQVYGLEGTGSRAGSLSSLESEGEKDAEKEDWGAGLEEWGPQFQKLAQLFKDREKEREEKENDEEGAKKEKEKKDDPEKKEKKERGEQAGEEGKD
uniref:Cadherin 24 n=1 Tax=Seriola lalandi dorsalis TaxID=1841481 RepID=A0A3B4WDR2_SERLL